MFPYGHTAAHLDNYNEEVLYYEFLIKVYIEK